MEQPASSRPVHPHRPRHRHRRQHHRLDTCHRHHPLAADDPHLRARRGCRRQRGQPGRPTTVTNALLRLDGGRTRTGRATCASTSPASLARSRVPSCASTPRMGPTTAPRSTRSATPPGRRRGSSGATSLARDATALADVGKVTTNTWVEYSLSPVTVTANGPYSFALLRAVHRSGSTSSPGRTLPTHRSWC